jgi:hypothetical protein
MHTRKTLIAALAVAAVALVARPAAAQFGARPLNGYAVGETYRVEAGGNFWNPGPNIVVSSEQLGIIGTRIDAIADLGFSQKRFSDLRILLRPATKHKFRIQYTPIKYSAEKVLARDITFNAIRYRIGIPVNSELKWTVWRFGYEWDAYRHDRGFVGLILEAKYTDVEVNLTSLFASEFARARAPVPAIGGIGRVYVMPSISATFEMTGFKLPNIDEEYKASYIDWDLYGTVNFNENVGAQFGYRSLDVNYTVEKDFGDFVLKGWYFGGVARF